MGNAGSTVSGDDLTLMWMRKVALFLCACALVYAMLMVLWLGWGGVYLRLYGTAANLLYRSPGSRALVYFSPSADAGDEIKVTFYDRQRVDSHGRPAPLLRIAHNVRYGVYIYVAFMIALIIASPIPWRRRTWALLWGLIAVHVFMVIRLGLLVAQLLNCKQVSLLTLSPFRQRLLLLAGQVFVINILPSFVVVIVLWALLSFRRSDWPAIVAGLRPCGDSRPQPPQRSLA